MTNKPVYHMSGVGDCQRALAAARLGNDPAPQTKEDIARLEHYSACEALAANQIVKELNPLIITGGELCEKCFKDFGIERYGVHVEIETSLFLLIGHKDREITVPGIPFTIPVEIKSLGKASFTRFKNSHFEHFNNYAYQECCYLHDAGVPGLYWCMNRDSGEALKYTINDDKGELKSLGYPNITLPLTFDDLVNKLNEIEVYVADNALPQGEAREDCYFCRYDYLCQSSNKKKAVVVTDQAILAASQSYIAAMEAAEQAEDQKAAAKTVLQNYAMKLEDHSFVAPGLSVNYKGMRTKKTYDNEILKKNVSPEILRLAERESAPFVDCIIRRKKQ